MDTQNVENKENIIYIKNVSDFLKEINEIGKEENKIKEKTLFYRGHSDQTYELKPSIYRDERFIENEDKIYRETIAKVPYDFNGKNTIESLVLMQHYGVPTRILDLTTNPLIALYFACVGDEKKDGEVIVFDIPQESTCYFDSDKVTILANLAKCGNDFKYETENFNVYEKEIKKLEEILEEGIAGTQDDFKYNSCFSDNFRDFIEKKQVFLKEFVSNNRFYAENIKTEIETFISEYSHKYSSYERKRINELEISSLKSLLLLFSINTLKTLLQERTEYLNEVLYFKSLLSYIREDKPYFKPIINPYDIGKVFAIKPKLDNPRIVRQHGAFLIFGIQKSHYFVPNISTKCMVEVPTQWIVMGKVDEFEDTATSEINSKTKNRDRIIIEKSKKDSILKELDNLGINKSSLFPEIDKVAEYIKEKYTQK